MAKPCINLTFLSGVRIMSHILVFGEKPHVNKEIAPALDRAFPQQKIIYLNILPFINPSMVYPRGLLWKDYPIVDNPRFNVASIESFRPMCFKENKMVLLENISSEEAENIKLHWSQIIYACDPDHSGSVSFSIIAKQWYGDNILNDPRLVAINLTSLYERHIETEIAKRNKFLEEFSSSLSYGETKRFIDWNWNTNSIVILSETLRRAGAVGTNPVISKYSLQALYFIQDNPGLSAGSLINRFHHWIGTGKYKESSLGSAASQSEIIEQLIRLGLLSVSENDVGVACYLSVSEIGERFIGMLHKDARDQDLPSRIEHWCNAGLEISRPSIERYIHTFFGKQKRYLHALSSSQSVVNF